MMNGKSNGGTVTCKGSGRTECGAGANGDNDEAARKQCMISCARAHAQIETNKKLAELEVTCVRDSLVQHK